EATRDVQAKLPLLFGLVRFFLRVGLEVGGIVRKCFIVTVFYMAVAATPGTEHGAVQQHLATAAHGRLLMRDSQQG
ncbi:hypothetical protein FRX31_005252, partial [Thalictrum thalictroides]